MRRVAAISSIVLGCAPAFASGGAATDAYEAIHNFNDPVSGANQLREFDFRDRASLNYARLAFTNARRHLDVT
jgi:hypothetical protein